MKDKKDNLFEMRHSLAHIMASAIKMLWPNTKFGVGPTTDNGFYYDIDIPSYKINENDLLIIEKQMRKIIKQNQVFTKEEVSLDRAKQWAIDNNQDYKLELLSDLEQYGTTDAKSIKADIDFSGNGAVEQVTFYTNGEFKDLCRGGHVDSTKDIGAFKLTHISGAYWRGKDSNPQMQRIYGVAFETQEELDQYLRMIEEIKKRDHRKLGKELDLYTTSPLVGAGLPLFTPRGTIVRDILSNYSNQLRSRFGFQKVWTPHITKKDLYETSGHWAKFGEELFLVKSQETSDEMALKPMNCPHHTQIFASKPRSYREMPVRFLETTTDYRDEKTGELGGLSRVRSLTQDDSHVFCDNHQIEQEITNLLQSAQELYGTMGMKLQVRLSYRDDSDSYLGDIKLWHSAQDQLKQAVEKNNFDYYEQEGEAAFYGPKIDFIATDALDRKHQVATIQLDFVQPERFGLSFINKDGQAKVPVMIHCALLGSIERFMSVLIEHTSGNLPFWMAPEQIRILTVNNTVGDYVERVAEVLDNIVLSHPLKFNELRFSIDDKNESLGKKIKDATNMKIPVQLIIGQKDKDSESVSVRILGEEKKIKLEELSNFIYKI